MNISGYCDFCEQPIKFGQQYYRNPSEGTVKCTRCKKKEIAARRAAKAKK